MGPGAGHVKGLAKRVIACLDVRANDAGDLVVTKGDQYDVRETDGVGREVKLPHSTSEAFYTVQRCSLPNLGARCLVVQSSRTGGIFPDSCRR